MHYQQHWRYSLAAGFIRVSMNVNVNDDWLWNHPLPLSWSFLYTAMAAAYFPRNKSKEVKAHMGKPGAQAYTRHEPSTESPPTKEKKRLTSKSPVTEYQLLAV
jgi:hypothetical protein